MFSAYPRKKGALKMDKKLIIGSDPAGFTLKEAVKAHLIEEGYEITDVGTLSPDKPVDYYDVGFIVGKAVSEKEFERGIIVCGSGMGVHIVAGKFPGVYCAVCESPWPVNRCRAINNCNVLAMGGFFITESYGIMMADTFLNTEFLEGFGEEDRIYLANAVEEIKKMEKEIYGK